MTRQVDPQAGEDEPLPVDVRLVPAALAAWTVTVLGIEFGHVVAGTICATALVGLVVCGITAARSKADVRVQSIGLAAFFVTVACYAGAAGVHAWSVERSPVLAAAQRGAWVTVSMTVSEDPRALRAGGPNMVMVRGDLARADIAGAAVTLGGRILVIAPSDGWASVLPGQNVTLRGRAAEPDRADLTVAVVTVRGAPIDVEDPGVVSVAAGSVRADLSAASHEALPTDRAGLLPGLVVGDVSSLDPGVENDFRAAGLTHLTAVSGANFSILIGAVLLLVRSVGIGPWPATALCVVVIVVFVIVARPSPSVLRAAVMGAIGLIAFVTGRRKQAVPALCTAVLVLLVLSPELAVDFGFVLSVFATAGLVLVAPTWADALRARGWRRGPAEVCAVAAAAHAVTAPVVAAMAGTFSVVGIAANILVAPVVAPITVVGALAAAIAPVSGLVAQWILVLTSAPLWWLITVAERASSAPASSLTVPDGALGAAVVLAAVSMCVIALRWRLFRWVAVLLCLWLSAGWLWDVTA